MISSRELQVASAIVRLEKQAALGAVGQSFVSGAKAVKGAMSQGTTALGQAARGAIGKGLVRTPLGWAAHGAIKAAPYGVGLYAANAALGDPIGNQLRLQKARFRARVAQHRGVYDPRTGVMY